MELTIDPSVIKLGLVGVRAYRISTRQPLLSTGPEPVAPPDVETFNETARTGYRRLLTSLGYPELTPAGESLQELIRERGWRSYGGMVDIVNTVVACNGGGVGLHRLADSEESARVLVRRAVGDERIVPAFSSRSRPIPTGDLTYGIADEDGGFNPLAWLGRRDCDSADRQLDERSTQALVVVLGCPDAPANHVDAVETMLQGLVAQHFPGASFEALANSTAAAGR